jgi:hypothetical protein
MAIDRLGPPPDHVVETEVDGDLCLYDPTREHVLVLNGTASDIWRLADGESDPGEIAAVLAAFYKADPDMVTHDVATTIDRLIAERFLPPS